jgi:glycosyltransferase involved in cell wall biosynthesis
VGLNKKSVLVLGPSLNVIGGVATHLKQIFSSKLSYEFNFIHFQVGSEGRKENFFTMILRLAFSAIALIVTIFSIKPCIVHLNTSMDSKAFWRDILYLLIFKIFDIKIIYQIHGGFLPQKFFRIKILTLFLKNILKLPDAVVVLTTEERLAYQRFVRLKRLVQIPNAVRVEDFKSIRFKKFDEKILKVVYIGRLIVQKGIMDVIEAFKILKDDDTILRIRLDIAGSGIDEEMLKSKVERLNLKGKIFFHGSIKGKEKLKFWQEAHIFAFPTYYKEGLPYAVLESLCSGTPLITTMVAGVPDAVKQNMNGLFVKTESPDNVAEAIKFLEKNRDLLKKMSRECIARGRKHYSIERLSMQFEKLYSEVLK